MTSASAGEIEDLLNRGLRAYREGGFDAAADLFRAAAASAPDDHRPWNNLGATLRKLDAFEEAEAALRHAVALAPEAVLQHDALGHLLHQLGRPEEAIAAYDRVLALAPGRRETLYSRALCLLALGRYGEAWPGFELRAGVPGSGATAPPGVPWADEDLSRRTLVVWPEQGLGDMIMASRFLPAAQAAAARTVVVAPPALVRLFQAMGLDAVASSGPLAVPGGALSALYLTLPAREGVTLETLPPPIDLRLEATRAGGVGIVTRGNPRHAFDRFRSLPPDLEAELMRLPGAVSLDPAATGATDMLDTARTVAGLDLVVTVDTSVAHLAGALGKPVWILLPAIGCDWRWMYGRDDSPWYPSARLFRQTSPGDWSGVVAEVTRALA